MQLWRRWPHAVYRPAQPTDSVRHLVLCFEARRLKPVCVCAVILCRLCGRTLDMLFHRYRLATVWHWSCDFCYCLRRFTPARLCVFFFFFALELAKCRVDNSALPRFFCFVFRFFLPGCAAIPRKAMTSSSCRIFRRKCRLQSHYSELEMRGYLRVILFRKCALFFFFLADAAIRHKFKKEMTLRFFDVALSTKCCFRFTKSVPAASHLLSTHVFILTTTLTRGNCRLFSSRTCHWQNSAHMY